MALIRPIPSKDFTYTLFSTSEAGANISVAKGTDNKATILVPYTNGGGTVNIQYSDDDSTYTTATSYYCGGDNFEYECNFTTHPYWRIYTAAVSSNYPRSWGYIITV